MAFSRWFCVVKPGAHNLLCSVIAVWGFQYVGTEELPAGPPFSNPTASVTGVANADGAMYHAAPAFMSDQVRP